MLWCIKHSIGKSVERLVDAAAMSVASADMETLQPIFSFQPDVLMGTSES